MYIHIYIYIYTCAWAARDAYTIMIRLTTPPARLQGDAYRVLVKCVSLDVGMKCRVTRFPRKCVLGA